MTSFSINKHWRLVTFSSFICSILFLVWLNRGPLYKPNQLPVLPNMNVSFRSSRPATRTQWLAPINIVSGNNSVEKEETALLPQEAGTEWLTPTNVVQRNSLTKKAEAASVEVSRKEWSLWLASSKVVNNDNSTVKEEASSPELGIKWSGPAEDVNTTYLINKEEAALHEESGKEWLASSRVLSNDNSTNEEKASSLEFGIEWLGPAKDVNATYLSDNEEETCNIFEGNWIYDPMRCPLYSTRQCPFLSVQVSCKKNGRQDSDYQNWNWEAKGCNIPRFNGTDMMERLRGKRLILVGDSLNRNQWESLACLLYSSLANPSRAHINFKSPEYKVFMAKDYSFSVEFYWSPFLLTLETKVNGSRVLKLDKLSASASKWRGADVMVFNTVHWWAQTGRFRKWDLLEHNGELVEKMDIQSAFAIGISVWADWIDRNIDPTKTTVFFRSISPEHKGKQSCENTTKPITDESFEYTQSKPIREIAERTIKSMKTPVRYLNITKLSEYRRDAHPSIYARTPKQRLIDPRSDCSHWCLPGVPDTWNKLLYASLVMYSSNNKSTM